MHNNGLQYLVKWKSYIYEDSTWEQVKNLKTRFLKSN
eukprot:SAG11_NODE_21326_length_427_cov_1.515244_1_plen_36_part_10